MMIRDMNYEDWPEVLAIYKQGIDSGKTTFNTVYPSWDEWNAGHCTNCRYLAVRGDKIAGFVAVSPTSTKPYYSGVVEVTIYVSEEFWHQGIGTGLLKKLIKECPGNNFWCLYSAIFSTNTNSINLHKKCGFRTIGYRERIAQDRHGNWLNTTLMEYRL